MGMCSKSLQYWSASDGNYCGSPLCNFCIERGLVRYWSRDQWKKYKYLQHYGALQPFGDAIYGAARGGGTKTNLLRDIFKEEKMEHDGFFVLVRSASDTTRYALHFSDAGISETRDLARAQRWSSVEAIIKTLRCDESRAGHSLQNWTIGKIEVKTVVTENVVRAFE